MISGKRITEKQEETIIKMFAEKKAMKAIAQYLHLNSLTVRRCLLRHNVSLRKNGWHFSKKVRIQMSKSHKGKKRDESFKQKLRKRVNELNPAWVGDKVGYNALHAWVRRHKPKPELCEKCKKAKPIDLSNISGKYLRDISDFEWICRKCHMEADGRIKNLKQFKEK